MERQPQRIAEAAVPLRGLLRMVITGRSQLVVQHRRVAGMVVRALDLAVAPTAPHLAVVAEVEEGHLVLAEVLEMALTAALCSPIHLARVQLFL